MYITTKSRTTTCKNGQRTCKDTKHLFLIVNLPLETVFEILEQPNTMFGIKVPRFTQSTTTEKHHGRVSKNEYNYNAVSAYPHMLITQCQHTHIFKPSVLFVGHRQTE